MSGGLFHKLTFQARTTNKLNRIRIAFENMMTPQELSDFSKDPGLVDLGVGLPAGKPPAIVSSMARGARVPTEADLPDRQPLRQENKQEVRSELRRHGGAARLTEKEQLVKQAAMSSFISHDMWCDKLMRMCNSSKKTRSEPFSRKRLRRNMYFFSSGGDRSNKVLLFCFTGMARRMMMPLPAFLQHMDASRVDVVLMCDPTKEGYRNGSSPTDRSFEGMLDQMKELMTDGPLKRSEYRGVATMGTSSGGLPSILAGLRLEVDAVLAVGSNDPNDERWQPVGGSGAAALMTRYAKEMGRAAPQLFLLYSADYPRDEEAAKVIGSIVPVKYVRYDVKRNVPTGHAVLWPILNTGKLIDLFNSTLFSPFQDTKPPRNSAWSISE